MWNCSKFAMALQHFVSRCTFSASLARHFIVIKNVTTRTMLMLNYAYRSFR